MQTRNLLRPLIPFIGAPLLACGSGSAGQSKTADSAGGTVEAGSSAEQGASPGTHPATGTQPNVLLIYIDDMGYSDLAANGTPVAGDVRTPNLDAIAANGVRFTNGYVSAPMCSPSRAGLITGRYQQRFGHETHMSGGDPWFREAGVRFGVPLTESTIANRMKAQGYFTYASGKWHLGDDWDLLPQQRGFDEYWGIIKPGNQLHLRREHFCSGHGLAYWDMPVESPANTTFLAEDYSTRVIKMLGEERDKPFFVYLSYTAVHAPIDASPQFLQNHDTAKVTVPMPYRSGKLTTTAEKRATLLAYMEETDHHIGRIINELEARGMLEDTLIFAISDNGGKPQNNGSFNVPLRGSKGMLYEGGIRVPFLMQWKGTIPAGQEIDEPVIQLDVMPTALSAAGAQIAPDWKLSGKNLLPLVTGKAASLQREALYWKVAHSWAVRHENWKLVHTATDFWMPPEAPSPELFDLSADPAESNNLAVAKPEKVAELKALYDTWNQHNVAPLWGTPETLGPNKVQIRRPSIADLQEAARYEPITDPEWGCP